MTEAAAIGVIVVLGFLVAILGIMVGMLLFKQSEFVERIRSLEWKADGHNSQVGGLERELANVKSERDGLKSRLEDAESRLSQISDLSTTQNLRDWSDSMSEEIKCAKRAIKDVAKKWTEEVH